MAMACEAPIALTSAPPWLLSARRGTASLQEVRLVGRSARLEGGFAVTPFGDYRGKLIDIAERIAAEGAKDNLDFLRRFRLVYRHLVATVDGTATELGFGPYGPMPMEMPGMRTPDIGKLLEETDKELGTL
jgi:hypothetical protein